MHYDRIFTVPYAEASEKYYRIKVSICLRHANIIVHIIVSNKRKTDSFVDIEEIYINNMVN